MPDIRIEGTQGEMCVAIVKFELRFGQDIGRGRRYGWDGVGPELRIEFAGLTMRCTNLAVPAVEMVRGAEDWRVVLAVNVGYGGGYGD